MKEGAELVVDGRNFRMQETTKTASSLADRFVRKVKRNAPCGEEIFGPRAAGRAPGTFEEAAVRRRNLVAIASRSSRAATVTLPQIINKVQIRGPAQ